MVDVELEQMSLTIRLCNVQLNAGLSVGLEVRVEPVSILLEQSSGTMTLGIGINSNECSGDRKQGLC